MIGKRVAIGAGDGYRPSLPLARARQVAARLGPRLPGNRARVLNNQTHTNQLIGILYERSNADLEELVNDCEAEAG